MRFSSLSRRVLDAKHVNATLLRQRLSSGPKSYKLFSSSTPPQQSSEADISCVMLNAARLDYDGKINFDKLDSVCTSVTRHDITDPSQVIDRVQGHNVVLNKEMPLTADMIDKFDASVQLIAEAGTGYNNIDLDACRNKGIRVCNVPTYATEAMAHIAITLVMALSCSLVPQAKAFAKGDRSYLTQCHLGSLAHFELTDKRIGLIGGLGTIGKRVAHMAQALGMEVVASSSTAPIGSKRDDGIQVVSFEDLMSTSDFVSVHCPLNKHTQGLVNTAALGMMKPSAYIVNTARGSIIDQDALVEALQSKSIAGAALDVFGPGSAPPPALPDKSPLYDLSNVILTPHIGWQRLESRQRVVDTIAENIASVCLRGEPSNINMETGLPIR